MVSPKAIKRDLRRFRSVEPPGGAKEQHVPPPSRTHSRPPPSFAPRPPREFMVSPKAQIRFLQDFRGDAPPNGRSCPGRQVPPLA